MNQSDTVRHAFRTGTKATLSDGTVINSGRKKDPALGELEAKKYEVDNKSEQQKSKAKQAEVVKIESPDYKQLIRSESEKSLVLLEAQRKLIEDIAEIVRNKSFTEIVVDVERDKDNFISRFRIKVND